MFGKVISLDIGAYNVKAVFAKITFRSINIEKRIIFKRSKNDTLESIIDRLVHTHDSGDHTPIVLFPSEKLQFRTLSFPFRSEKEIKAVLKPELEAILPKQDEEILTDFIFSNEEIIQKPRQTSEERDQENLVSVIAASTGKELFSRYLEPWLDRQFVPGYVGAESVAVRSLEHLSPKLKELESKLYIDLGYKKTVLTIVALNHVQYIRVIPVGAQDFNEIILRESSIEEERSDDVRITLGNYLWDADAQGLAKNAKAEEKFLKQVGIHKKSMERIQTKAKKLLGELLREIRLSIFSHFQNSPVKFTEERIHSLVMLGGFSRQDGLKEIIASSLNITFYDFSEIKTGSAKIEGDGEEKDFLLCHGFLSSIAFEPAKYNINLLQDEFSSLSITQKGSSFKVPVVLAGIALILFILNLFFTSFLKGLEEKELTSELEQRVKKYFPDVPQGNDPVRAIRGHLVSLEGKFSGQTIFSGIKLIDVMKVIAQATASEKLSDIKMVSLKYADRNVVIVGTVSKVTVAEEFKKLLDESLIFESINDPKVKKEITKDVWSFTINARLFSKLK